MFCCHCCRPNSSSLSTSAPASTRIVTRSLFPQEQERTWHLDHHEWLPQLWCHPLCKEIQVFSWYLRKTINQKMFTISGCLSIIVNYVWNHFSTRFLQLQHDPQERHTYYYITADIPCESVVISRSRTIAD